LGENPKAATFPIRSAEVRIGFRSLAPESNVVVVLNGRPFFNGLPATAARFVTREFVAKPSRQPNLAEEYLHLELPPTAMIAPGQNEFRLTVTGGSKPVEVTDLEVRYDYQNDLEQIWNRVPFR